MRLWLAVTAVVTISCSTTAVVVEESETTTQSDRPLELENPYVDKTPLCHYLERGLDDFSSSTVGDWYALTLPEVRTLSDIDELTLGLDAPYTHCKDNPRSNPCSDEDTTKSFCVDQLSLRVMGITLFHETAANNACLMTVKGGRGGMRTIDGSDLRANSYWGFTAADLENFFKYADVDRNGKVGLRVPGISVPGERIARTIEGGLGEAFSRNAKGCADTAWYTDDENPYCGNRRAGLFDPLIVTRSVNDCDLGNCPSPSERKSSPWAEVKGQGDKVHVDLDFDLLRGALETGDCIQDPLSAQLWCGTRYPDVFHGSIAFDLGFACTPDKVFAALGNKTLAYPMCPAGVVESRCWKIESVGFLPAKVARLKCPAGDGAAICNDTTSPFRTHYRVRSTVSNLSLQSESGLYAGFAAMLCAAVGCNVNDVATAQLNKYVDPSMFEVSFFSDLSGCPNVSVKPDGSVVIDLETLDTCPPGSLDTHCTSGGYQADMGEPHSDVSLDLGIAAAPPANANLAALVVPTSTKFGFTRLPALVKFVRARSTAKSAGSLAAKQVSIAASERFKMKDIDSALAVMCAAAPVCSPGIDVTKLPLAELAAVDFTAVQAIISSPCMANESPGACTQRKTTMLHSLLGFLIDNSEFKNKCVGYSYPGQTSPDLVYYSAVKNWFTTKFLPRYEAEGANSCQALAKIEKVFPALGVELRVRSKTNVSDSYVFVNLRDNDSQSVANVRSKLKCAHLEKFALPTSKAPTCDADGKLSGGPGADDGHDCGRVPGGACMDIRKDDTVGADPEDERFHPNGDVAWWARCGEDIESGRTMACVSTFYPGAGTNEAGSCKICGTPSDGEDPNQFTMIGCRPEGACLYGLALFPDGKCWPETELPPSWMCEADCEHVYNDYGYCVHDVSWRNWAEDRFPQFGAYAQSYTRPICAEFISCTNSGAQCASQGKACNPATGSCVTECVTNADCAAVVPAPAYPEWFVCDPMFGTCKSSFAVVK